LSSLADRVAVEVMGFVRWRTVNPYDLNGDEWVEDCSPSHLTNIGDWNPDTDWADWGMVSDRLATLGLEVTTTRRSDATEVRISAYDDRLAGQKKLLFLVCHEGPDLLVAGCEAALEAVSLLGRAAP